MPLQNKISYATDTYLASCHCVLMIKILLKLEVLKADVNIHVANLKHR